MSVSRYVLGFAFTEDNEDVLLLNKVRPSWQRGRWNGVGGKIERDEGHFDAMIREFLEETGVQTQLIQWTHVGVYTGTDPVSPFEIQLFRCTLRDDQMPALVKREEPLHWFSTSLRLPGNSLQNVHWLVHLCATRARTTWPVTIQETTR